MPIRIDGKLLSAKETAIYLQKDSWFDELFMPAADRGKSVALLAEHMKTSMQRMHEAGQEVCVLTMSYCEGHAPGAIIRNPYIDIDARSFYDLSELWKYCEYVSEREPDCSPWHQAKREFEVFVPIPLADLKSCDFHRETAMPVMTFACDGAGDGTQQPLIDFGIVSIISGLENHAGSMIEGCIIRGSFELTGAGYPLAACSKKDFLTYYQRVGDKAQTLNLRLGPDFAAPTMAQLRAVPLLTSEA